MPSSNEAIIAAAGGGKTTRIVHQALTAGERVAMVTFTRNNTDEIERKIYQLNHHIPPEIEVRSWYSFLIRELARPYQSYLYRRRIDGMTWVAGRSDRFANKSDVGRYYFANRNFIYSDKVSHFVCHCNERSKGAVIRRLEERFDRIYLDEIQDLAGYDLNLLELILKSTVRLTLVGDHRQSTFKTNNSAKNKAFSGFQIIEKLKAWDRDGLCKLRYEVETHRCNQKIADLADSFFPNEPKTISKNLAITGHDGVFLIPSKAVEQYVHQYSPQVLRLDKKTDCGSLLAKNMGDSKGLTFDRVLIFPHKGGQVWLSSGDYSHVEGSLARLYVGTTRARYSVAFVFDGKSRINGMIPYNP